MDDHAARIPDRSGGGGGGREGGGLAGVGDSIPAGATSVAEGSDDSTDAVVEAADDTLVVETADDTHVVETTAVRMVDRTNTDQIRVGGVSADVDVLTAASAHAGGAAGTTTTNDAGTTTGAITAAAARAVVDETIAPPPPPPIS